ncbi:MAG TPA: hypothetical protein VGI76_11455 [Solirubrobacteraceae bacterium]|jgi:hypothetical protein
MRALRLFDGLAEDPPAAINDPRFGGWEWSRANKILENLDRSLSR